MLPVKKILYPTDFSSFSTPAYFHAVALAENHNASLTVLYVLTPTELADEPPNRSFWRDQLEQVRPSNDAIPVHHVLLEGEPAVAIVRYATDARMDLIVMGTHGRDASEHPNILMGSVAEQVLRGAPCSVLVVKMPKGQPSVERPHVGSVASLN